MADGDLTTSSSFPFIIGSFEIEGREGLLLERLKSAKRQMEKMFIYKHTVFTCFKHHKI